MIDLGMAPTAEWEAVEAKGCGICVEECPAGAITLEPEES